VKIASQYSDGRLVSASPASLASEGFQGSHYCCGSPKIDPVYQQDPQSEQLALMQVM
jgi:hypothetical protein